MQRKMDKVIENIYTMEEQNRRRQMEEKITGEDRGAGGRVGGGEKRGKGTGKRRGRGEEGGDLVN